MNALPLYFYSSARSALFSLEYTALNMLQNLYPGQGRAEISLKTAREIRAEIQKLLRRDSANIAKGMYPAAVLKPELPSRHLLRLPRIISDGVLMAQRRRSGKTAVFDESEREFFSDTPKYYHRNFHFQTGGYLSRRSAELYEHQVEILFGGAADAMRRLILEPLRRKFGPGDGHGLSFLEIGAGTGRATRFVRLAFPRAKITAVDLSDPYLKEAERNLANFPRIDFVQADGAKLPFLDGRFDAAYSVFLFHELPLDARRGIISDSKRVLKRGGFLGFVDSLQAGDHKPFDGMLETFPKNYHEPFFRNYLAHPMEAELRKAGLTGVESDRGFYSKVCFAERE